MYSANDWRCYALLHADKVSKWEWPGGNNSKAYNEWYYSHHKDKWRQYYLNKNKKQGGSPINSKDVRKYLALEKMTGDYNRDMNSGNYVKALNALAKARAVGVIDTVDPEFFEGARKVNDRMLATKGKYRHIVNRTRETLTPNRLYSELDGTYQNAAEYPEQQTPSRGASRRRQTR
ncbi:MAG: hypothetical protein ILA11_11320 [Butyrivibrio sp.]|nr:hypothetical protein [Butyrivibrio sp.]